MHSERPTCPDRASRSDTVVAWIPLRRRGLQRRQAPDAVLPMATCRDGGSLPSRAGCDFRARSGCRRQTTRHRSAADRTILRGGSEARATVSYGVLGELEEGLHEVRCSTPFARLGRKLLSPRRCERVVLGALVVVGRAPLAADGAIELELAEHGIERAVVQRDPVGTDLLDAPPDTIAVQRPEYCERAEHHERERPLRDVLIACHATSPGCWFPTALCRGCGNAIAFMQSAGRIWRFDGLTESACSH